MSEETGSERNTSQDLYSDKNIFLLSCSFKVYAQIQMIHVFYLNWYHFEIGFHGFPVLRLSRNVLKNVLKRTIFFYTRIVFYYRLEPKISYGLDFLLYKTSFWRFAKHRFLSCHFSTLMLSILKSIQNFGFKKTVKVLFLHPSLALMKSLQRQRMF